MKKNKLLLSALLVVAIAGSAFAVKSANFAPANVYVKSGSVYTLTSCATSGEISCAPATVPAANTYFTFSSGSYTSLPVGTTLWRAE